MTFHQGMSARAFYHQFSEEEPKGIGKRFQKRSCPGIPIF